MARSFRSLWAIPLAVAAYVFFATFPHSQLVEGAETQINSTVKVVLKDGHGSGVYIGNNEVLTAAHVALGEAGLVKVIAADGKEKFATVAWLNMDYDLALLRIRGDVPETLLKSEVSCKTPAIGERIEAYGSPGANDFLTMKGYVAGGVTSKDKWKEVISADLTILPGMSGGPVFNSKGEVAGISVGVALIYGGIVRIGFVVPGSTICKLMV